MSPTLLMLLAGGGLVLLLALAFWLGGLSQRETVDPEAEKRALMKKVRQIEVRTRHIVNEVFAGNYHSAFHGQGMEFQEVRDYVAGDDIRSIDWNVTARMNAPFIKKFREERELTMLLVVDISPSQDFGSGQRLKRQVAAEIAAVLAFAAVKNNDKVGLLLHTDTVEHFIPPGKGPRHVLRLINDVLEAKPTSTGTDFRPAFEHINLTTRRKAFVFIISDFLAAADYQRPLAVLGRRHDVVAVITGDERERDWPATGIVGIEDAETGERRLVDLGNAAVRRRIAERFDERREATLQTLRKSGVATLPILANQNYETALMRFFRQRSRRG